MFNSFQITGNYLGGIGALSYNHVQSRAVPCNQDPRKKKGVNIAMQSFCLFIKGEYLKGGIVQHHVILCNLMCPRATKIPKRTFFPILEYAVLTLGMGFTQPSWFGVSKQFWGAGDLGFTEFSQLTQSIHASHTNHTNQSSHKN
jgi:hypothetical protein